MALATIYTLEIDIDAADKDSAIEILEAAKHIIRIGRRGLGDKDFKEAVEKLVRNPNLIKMLRMI